MHRAVIAVALLATLAVAGGAVARAQQPPPPVEIIAPEPAPSPAPVTIVDVAGAVARPGVVHLPAGARVVDAIAAAGGAAADADTGALNKAAPVRDGSRIYVPRVGEPGVVSAAGPTDQRIDLNHASEAELVALPGIGPSTASKILRSRAERRFARPEELQTRGLVTARVFADIKDLVVAR